MGKIGWIAGAIGIVGVIASWLTPQKSLARKRRKIKKLEGELEELFEGSYNSNTTDRIRRLQDALARLNSELISEAS